MTHVQRMDRPISITLKSADWDMIQGLVTQERNNVKAECFDAEHEGRKPYLDTLERVRLELIRRNS